MDVKMMFSARNISKEELRALLQKVREWELTTPRTELDSFTFTTEPPLSQQETVELFDGISPKYQNLVSIPLPKNPVLSLGPRQVVVNGEILGTIEEVTLNIGEAGEVELEKLQRAQRVSLERMVKG